MSSLARQVADKATEAQARQCRHMDAELKFCRLILSRCDALANHGESESATRDAWLVEDTASAIERVLAKVENAERLNRYRTELTCVNCRLDELKRCLGISLERN